MPEKNDSPIVPAPSIAEIPSPTTTPRSNEPVDHAIPDGGYGWVIVFSVFTINAFTWGVLASYGVYLAHYLSHSIFPGATSLDFAYIGGLNFGVSMLAASPVTYLIRHAGTHLPMALGVVVQTSGFVAASFATSIWHLYLTQGILVGLGVGLLFIPSVSVTSQWFDKKRALANSINSAGSGVGGIIISLATTPMINKLSLAWSLRIIGIVSATMNILAICLIRNRNKVIRPPMHPFNINLFLQLPVFLLLSWGFFSMVGYVVIIYSLSDFGRSIGLNASQASSVTAIMNLGTALGRPCIGLLSDRYGRIEVAGLTTLATAGTIWGLWMPAQSYALTVVFALLNGGTAGVFWMTISTLSVEVTSLTSLPSMLALAFGTIILPTTFTEVVALKMRQPASSRPYLYPQIFTGLAYLMASAMMLGLWIVLRRRKRGESK
ncbi:MFS transporter, MCP family, solute carrier family 16, member 6 [Melanomma pulvis-pyrius CBS 109.77]|uniref:MFS transporter, MCP family, solute carrier family 16, member 6 n=1 Tax=Melanomma pulvis-pyrius CBS 109.77 TaxID=1314802 RepID=A0A6A6XUD7_9PLEO|nr:MFS transporter, MCP family, solute carrier family 16, member 6 [Melanomma pulvis-pyrius CBS 109.77]